ncbi:MAG: alpha/beta fold hydrolase [Candidatus Limnocylindria bacterium]
MPDSGFLDVPGGRIYYEAEGTGHPIVLIHAGVANLRMWNGQASALAERYRVIRYDTRGFGLTESEDVAFSNRADLVALMDHLDAPSAHVCGLSRGGIIALDFTLEHPQRVDALIFAAGGIGGWESGESSDPDARAFWEEAERRWEAHDWERLSDMETAFWVNGPGQPSDRVDQLIRDRVHDWILSNYRAQKPEGTPQPLEPPAAGRLGEITARTLVLVGDLDERGTQAACRHLAESVSGARLEVFEGAAHMLNLEQPERFARVVLDFLAEVDAARVV